VTGNAPQQTDSPPDDQEPPRRRRWLIAAAIALMLIAVVALSSIRIGGSTTTTTSPPTFDDLGELGEVDEGPTSEEAAPDFTLTTFTGDEFTLSTHFAEAGTPVFLNLWASWCFPCREEMPAIDAAAERYGAVRFVGVAVQDEEAPARQFAEDIAVGYPIGVDATGEINRDYDPLGLPASYIISADGIILERIYGQVDEAEIDAKLGQWFGG
jgi:thiol-disulfide isomerase/thioredoxin